MWPGKRSRPPGGASRPRAAGTYASSSSNSGSAMAELKIDHRRYAFRDYGSGKGKALLLTSD